MRAKLAAGNQYFHRHCSQSCTWCTKLYPHIISVVHEIKPTNKAKVLNDVTASTLFYKERRRCSEWRILRWHGVVSSVAIHEAASTSPNTSARPEDWCMDFHFPEAYHLPESIFGHPLVVSKTQCYITVSTHHTIRTLICTTCFDLYLNHSQVLITIKTVFTTHQNPSLTYFNIRIYTTNLVSKHVKRKKNLHCICN
jgi:hypothetical protein